MERFEENLSRESPDAVPLTTGPSSTGPSSTVPSPIGPPPTGPCRTRNSLLELAMVGMLALLIALLLKVYVAEAYEIRGRSMQPTFEEDERVMVLKVFYEIHRGDVIIFTSSEDPHKDLIKRVIGLPGDVVVVEDGRVTVNGEKLDEHRYVKHRDSRHERLRVQVPEGKYYVLGDNRPDSQDSRKFQAIDASSIKGKVILRWWPPGRLGSGPFEGE